MFILLLFVKYLVKYVYLTPQRMKRTENVNKEMKKHAFIRQEILIKDINPIEMVNLSVLTLKSLNKQTLHLKQLL